jgi:hypothetical protein
MPGHSAGFSGSGQGGLRSTIRLQEEFVDAKIITTRGSGQTNVKINHFKGNDPSKWNRGIPTYEYANLGEIYDGIDFKLRATGNNCEKLFFVHPDADPARIKMRLEGADRLDVNSIGQLDVTTADGLVTFTKPIAYQLIDGQKHSVDVAYELSDSQYGFTIGKYDNSRLLVIDPLLASTYLGGSGMDGADGIPNIDIALNSEGDVFVAGITQSADFPTSPESYQTEVIGESDIFLAKFDQDLKTLKAATVIGGDSIEHHPRICLDAAGNIYLVGTTNSANYPTTLGSFDGDLSGEWDVFVSKLNGNLSILMASTYLGGEGMEGRHTDLMLDPSGDCFVAGHTDHSSFPTTAGAFNENYTGGSSDLFVSRLDTSLSVLVASTLIGGSLQDEGTVNIALTDEGNIVLFGSTGSDDYPITPAAYDTSFNGPYSQGQYDLDLCVSILDNSLVYLLASTFLGGNNFERAYRLAVAGNGDVYVTGHTASPDYPVTPGAFDDAHNGFDETFVTRLDGSLTSLLSSTYFTPGDAGGGFFSSMAFDTNGDLWLVGGSGEADFPVTGNAYDTTYNGGDLDAIIVKLGYECDTLLYATFLGGSGRDLDAAITAIDGDVFVAGYTASSNFPSEGNSYDQSYNGYQDAYVARFTLNMFTAITGGQAVNDIGICMGVCLVDYDNDNYPDLFVPVHDGNNRLYRNKGDGSFSEPSGNIIANDDSSNAGCWADFDNDGDLDAYLANGLHESVVNYYYMNNGDGSFTKIIDDAVVFDQAASITAVCADYDNDGALDIFTPSWMFAGLSNDQLYRGVGDGTFIKITSSAIVSNEDPSGLSLWTDYDDDGDQDLIVSKVGAGASDMLFMNDGGEFTAITGLEILTVERGQGFDFGDFDNDADQDLFIPTWEGHNSALFENSGGGMYTRVTDQPITSDGHWSTASCSGDFDNDGDLDIFMVNDNNYEDRTDHFYINDGNGVFSSYVDSFFVNHTGNYSCKVTAGDYDRDGDLDLYVVNWYIGEPNLLYRNNNNGNNWLEVSLEGTVSNRSGIGAKVRVLANINGIPKWQMRELRIHMSSRSQSPLEFHFGLGDASIIDSVKVEWPSGMIDVQTAVSVNQFLVITETRCGDANSDEEVNVGDAVYLINYVFRGGPAPDPIDAGDANADGDINVGDAVYLINYIFKGGSPPACG